MAVAVNLVGCLAMAKGAWNKASLATERGAHGLL